MAQSFRMNLLFLFVALFQVQTFPVVLTQAFDEVVAYVGDTITLASGGKSSPSKILWSIFANTTFIARYQNAMAYTELFPQYSNRLRLSESTGNLTIQNLRTQDALVYKVELFHQQAISERRIKLLVRQHLPEPTTAVIFSADINESRLVWLKCSSAENGVEFSWDVQRPRLTSYISGSGELAAVYERSQGAAVFTCNTRRGEERTSRDHLDQIEPSPGPSDRNKYLLVFVSGVLVGVLLLGAFLYILVYKKYDVKKKATAPANI